MSELRYSKTKNRWVIIAPTRARRPNALSMPSQSTIHPSPFIYGNEHLTPPETFAVRESGSESNKEGWYTRVVPNKYHALAIEESATPYLNGFFEGFGGFGAHEVVIDTPKDDFMPSSYSKFDWVNIFVAIRERMAALSQDARFKYVSVFKNHGEKAGATIAHPHTQILALPIIPTDVEMEIEIARSYYKRSGRVLIDDEINEELKAESRMVYENATFAAFCPFASSFSFELKIAPKLFLHRFERCDEGLYQELANVFCVVLKKLNIALKDHSYNIIFKLQPFSTQHKEPHYFYQMEHFYRWHIEIVPRLYGIAGFELGTGMSINPISPEDAAEYLRGTK